MSSIDSIYSTAMFGLRTSYYQDGQSHGRRLNYSAIWHLVRSCLPVDITRPVRSESPPTPLRQLQASQSDPPLITQRLTRQAAYVQHNTEARSRNYCCHGKAISITYSECVSLASVIRHSKRMRHIILSCVTCPDVPYFSTLSHKRHDFREKSIHGT